VRGTAKLAAIVALLAACAAWPGTAAAETVRDGPVVARVTDGAVVLASDRVERAWARDALRTTSIRPVRGAGGAPLTAGLARDFTLELARGVSVPSDAFRVAEVTVERLERGGLHVAMALEPRGAGPASLLRATRHAEAYPGVAAIRVWTELEALAPVALAGWTLDEAATGRAEPTIHAFRAGADWREPDWGGPDLSVGDPHAGTWRETRSAPAGAPLAGPAQWLSLGGPRGRLFMVAEAADLPSMRAEYGHGVARLRVELARDAIVLGPFEENAHVENPGPGPGRVRVVRPGEPLRLEAALTGLAATPAAEATHFHRWLRDHRLAPYRHDAVFNTNGTDDDRISTGAKDDVDFATLRELAPVARAMNVDTFVLDDGWQARSGDWEPDSPEYPEPRWDGEPGSKFAPRFPDAEFRAVREAIAPMRLGLWMSPMHFNPSAETYRSHPDWACQPVGTGLAAYNALQPDEGSNEAGLGEWSVAAIAHVEARIRHAIEEWDVAYFKFDFLAWLDCAGANDLHEMRDAFVAMLDRVQRDHPGVTLQVDETNDYRLFPFLSVTRGPSWFQNGTPEPARLLHNLWNLAPWVPPYSIGQHALGGRAWEEHPVDTLMAAALPSHVTFFSDIRTFPAEVVARAGDWLAFRRRNVDALAQMAHPLLADPLEGGWTALQTWDRARGVGALLAFRQGSPEATRRIALEEVPRGRRYDLVRAPGGERVATVGSAALRAGIDVTIPSEGGAHVLVIRQRRSR
jgi:hypothetical protein